MDRKPLQSHGRYIETWIPPAGDRFTEYEESDRDWVEFFGFGGGGTVRRKLAGLYDVRDREENLVGYTDMNPADCDWGYMDVAVMTEKPIRWVQDPDLGFATEDELIQRVRVEVMPYAISFRTSCRDPNESHHDFSCWVIDIMDGPKLAVCGWLKCRGEDNIREFAHQLHMQARDYQMRHPTLVNRM
tara:strand:- start:340 stop:900 length:561 start_codon:yes stop_codon:yes gene_type:complete